MSLQQVIELVTLHHVFWQIESRRAPVRERKHCEFFRSQCQDEIAYLKREIEVAAMPEAPDYSAADAHAPPDRVQVLEQRFGERRKFELLRRSLRPGRA